MSSDPDPDQTRQSELRWSKRLSVQRYRRLGDRLVRMGPAELGNRLWQRARKAAASVGYQARPSRRDSQELLKDFGPAPQARLAELFNRHFYFGPLHRQTLVAQLAAHCPDAARDVVKLADALGTSGIDILGERVRLIPGTIDWQADPRTQQRAWSDRSFEESAAIGVAAADVKYVWEVNRHQFLTYLGRAYWSTGDARYVEQAVGLIDDWTKNNPSGRGVNWCSGLEVAMRSISWLWALPYVLAWPALDGRFLERWLTSLSDHHDYLAQHLSVYTDPTNHLIGEATALWMLSVLFPEFPGSARQSRRALDILAREIERQVTPDGVNCEHATSYHRFVLDFYLQIVALARRAQCALPAIIEQRVEAMLGFVAALAGPHGEAPMIGDSDDARGVPFPECNGWDFRDLLSTGAVYFARPDWKQLSGRCAEVTLWLLGAEAGEKYRGLAAKVASASSRIFTQGGYCVFEATDARNRLGLIFDAAPLGLWPNAAHGHADALSIQIRLNGKFLLADPGTGTYFTSRSTRDGFRRTSAHNTVSVDGFDQADIYDVFKWVNPMSVQLVAGSIGEHFDYASAKHDGYSRLRKPIVHYRSVLFVRPMEWIVIDHFEGEGEHRFTRHFNFSPDLVLQSEGPRSVRAIERGTASGLQFVFPEGASQGETSIEFDSDGIWSERYGQHRKAPRLQVETVGRAPLALFTFVSPTRGPLGRFRCYTETLSGGQAVVGRWARNQVEDVVLVNPARRDIQVADCFRSDAGFLFVRRREGGGVERAFLAGKAKCRFSGGIELIGNAERQGESFIDPAIPQSAERTVSA